MSRETNTSPTGQTPKLKASKILINLLVMAVVGLVYFYFNLPAFNLHSPDLYLFIFILCVVYILCALVTSGLALHGSGGIKEYFRFIKSQCLPIGALLVVLLVIALVGSLISIPVFRASSYRDLLSVQTGDFTADVTQISFDEIPTLDRTSAEFLGDRQMGTLSDMVSQFEYSGDSSQINYQGRPVRVAPIAYADIFKWFTNRSEGLPAYVVVDMVTQEATVTRLDEGIKYSSSEPFNRNIMRHLRFRYPTMMFADPVFEIDELGQPWWIAPRVVKTIGLFGGTDIRGAVLVDAITGDCTYYDADDVPTWVDNLYDPDLIMKQYDYHGTLVHGFINSLFGQKDVTQTTQGYNYIAINDDVYAYTGVTSSNADQSNLGFVLCNMRTKETHFYTAPGATENVAARSAEGMVQDLGYTATFPILLNIAGEPTYFIPLKDAANLVKMYAMVNVARYEIVGIGSTVIAAEQEYTRLLSERGITVPTDSTELSQTTATGTIVELRSAVLDGNTYYFIRLEGEEIFYSVSAADNNVAVILNVGDSVTIKHASADDNTNSILVGYTVTLNEKIAGQTFSLPSVSSPAPQTPEGEPAAPETPAPSAVPAE